MFCLCFVVVFVCVFVVDVCFSMVDPIPPLTIILSVMLCLCLFVGCFHSTVFCVFCVVVAAAMLNQTTDVFRLVSEAPFFVRCLAWRC